MPRKPKIIHLLKKKTYTPAQEGQLRTERLRTLTMSTFEKSKWPALQIQISKKKKNISAQVTLEDLLMNKRVVLESPGLKVGRKPAHDLRKFFKNQKECRTFFKNWKKRQQGKYGVYSGFCRYPILMDGRGNSMITIIITIITHVI